MSLTISGIEKEAAKILLKIKAGELMDGCSMSAIQTPTTEAWEKAKYLSESGKLTAIEKAEVFSKLDKHVQSQLSGTNYDDFDLIYERLLQLINR